MSELIKKEVLSDEYVNQVRTFGALSYTPERICRLLGLKGAKRTTLMIGFAINIARRVYAIQQGRALGEYNIDAELAKKAEKGEIDAITLLEERKNEREEKDLRMNLFGI